MYIVKDLLHLRKGSFASKYLQLFIAFGVSGLVHGGAAMLYHGSFEDGGAMKAFLGQAIIIFVEDHLVEFGKKIGFRDSLFWRLVGFAWTVLAVGASMEGWTGSLLEHGLWVHEREMDLFGIGPKV
jgi:Membrane bound O-acyl transferase family